MVRFLSATAYSVLFPYIVIAVADIFPRLSEGAGMGDIVARKTCQGQSYGYSTQPILSFALISSTVR